MIINDQRLTIIDEKLFKTEQTISLLYCIYTLKYYTKKNPPRFEITPFSSFTCKTILTLVF